MYAFLCIHGRCADDKYYSSSLSTKSGGLNQMRTASFKRHSYYCNMHDIGTDASLFAWGRRALGCCVARLGACALRGGAHLGRYSLLLQGKLAATCCRIQPAHSGGYRNAIGAPQNIIRLFSSSWYQLGTSTAARNTDLHHD